MYLIIIRITLIAKSIQLKKLDIPQMKFHALRHSYATRLFEAGVPTKTVQALMGHYDISITMDIYTHVMVILLDY